MSFKKRKTGSASGAANGAAPTAAAPTGGNNAAAPVLHTHASADDVVKAESKEGGVDVSMATSGCSSSAGHNTNTETTHVQVPSDSAAAETKPIVVSMKIGNMQGGGAKRKFRVREPSPP